MGAPLLCRPGGDFVLAARAHPAAGPGEILLSEAQRMSLLVCEDDWYEWVPFAQGCEPLAELVLEVRISPITPLHLPRTSLHLPITGRARARGAAPG